MDMGNIIIDVGANYGGFSLEIAKRNPNKRVYAIEAEPSLASLLIQRAKENNLTNHYTESIAISDVEGESIFYVSDYGDHGTSSLLEFSLRNINEDEYWHARTDLQHNRKIIVNTKPLSIFLDHIQYDEIDFLKIDIQGLDLVALKTAGHHLKRVRAGMLEIPAISNKSLYDNNTDELRDVLNFLKENNFIVYSIKPNDEASNEFNVFFVRFDVDYLLLEKELNLRQFHFYDGKNYWHAPSYKLEFPEQHIINLNTVLREKEAHINRLDLDILKISEELSVLKVFKNRITSNFICRILSRLKLM